MDFQSDCLTSHVTQCFRFVSPQESYITCFFSKILIWIIIRDNLSILWNGKERENVKYQNFLLYIFFSKKVPAMELAIGVAGSRRESVDPLCPAGFSIYAIKQPRLFLVGVNFIPGCAIPWADSPPHHTNTYTTAPSRDCFRCADLTSFRYPSYSIPGTVKSTRKEGCREN